MPAFPLWQVFLPILLAAAAPSACRAIFFNDPILIPSLECFFKFSLLDFNPSNLDRYDTYFRNDSVMEVAQTGQYLGPEGIKEYIRFGYGVFSPYLATGPTDGQTPHISFQGYEDGKCILLAISHSQYSLDPNYTSSNITFRAPIIYKVYYDFGGNFISRMNLFFSEAFWDTFFDKFLGTDLTRQYVCDTMTGPICGDTIPDHNNCVATLQGLPTVHDHGHVDGNSQGCRALHAVLASFSDQHCPHLSFAPQVDVHGNIKCQTVGTMQPEDLFTADEITKFLEIERAAGMDPTTGIKIIDPAPPASSPPPCGLLGLSILCFNGCGFLGRWLGLCVTA